MADDWKQPYIEQIKKLKEAKDDVEERMVIARRAGVDVSALEGRVQDLRQRINRMSRAFGVE